MMNKKKLKVLCVCSKGRNRSRYLASYLKKKSHATRFGGIEKFRLKRFVGLVPKLITQKDVDWAEIIIIARKRLFPIFKKKFKFNGRRIIVLDVTDSERLIPKEFSYLRELDYEEFQKKWTYPQLREAIKKYLPLKKR